MPNRKLNVFLCHAKEDKPTVRELYRQLTAEGWMDVWLDEENLLPGQEWDLEIEKAVEQADVVIVCLSTHSVDKEGYVQKELRFVLNIADEKPEGTIFVVPLRLDDCQVPRRIRAWQWVDYFPKANRNRAYTRLLESLKFRARKFDISTESPDAEKVRKEAEEKIVREYESREILDAMENRRKDIEARELKAKEERKRNERIAAQRAEKRRKALTNTFSKINFKRILAFGGIVLALFALYFGGKFVIDNLPIIPVPTQTPGLGVGSTWTSPKDGMVMMYVPAGEFTMGSDSGDSDEKPVHTVTLDSYWIDKTEVTNSMYAKCVNAGKCNPPSSSKSYTHDSYYGNAEYDDFPVIYVSWNGAKAYCEWRGDGTRLPTEAEWEKAASWDDDKKEKRIYPWGDSIDCSYANYSYCRGDTTKVGDYPSGASFYGLLDMVGNVKEWVSSLYQSYPYNVGDGREKLASSYSCVLRGGSWHDLDDNIRSSNRFWDDPSVTFNIQGFRCARSAE